MISLLTSNCRLCYGGSIKENDKNITWDGEEGGAILVSVMVW